VVAALALSAVGYYFAYRSIYAAEGGYALSRRQIAAVVAIGFSGLFDTGGLRREPRRGGGRADRNPLRTGRG
jgi:hypothetical protein